MISRVRRTSRSPSSSLLGRRHIALEYSVHTGLAQTMSKRPSSASFSSITTWARSRGPGPRRPPASKALPIDPVPEKLAGGAHVLRDARGSCWTPTSRRRRRPVRWPSRPGRGTRSSTRTPAASTSATTRSGSGPASARSAGSWACRSLRTGGSGTASRARATSGDGRGALPHAGWPCAASASGAACGCGPAKRTALSASCPKNAEAL